MDVSESKKNMLDGTCSNKYCKVMDERPCFSLLNFRPNKGYIYCELDQ